MTDTTSAPAPVEGAIVNPGAASPLPGLRRNPAHEARLARARAFAEAINAAQASGRDTVAAIHATARALGMEPVMNLELPPGH
jgi:hypothetical protein